ncbi:hypothetical protein [Francisella salimarina]|uniref:hypothetical protein n=1 Tax=Francisella salimarina TaxID=2599927 RepID=UPI00375015F6
MTKNIFTDKNNYIFASTITASVFFSSLSSSYLYNHQMLPMIWAFVFGIFLPFYRFGNTKLEQIKSLATKYNSSSNNDASSIFCQFDKFANIARTSSWNFSFLLSMFTTIFQWWAYF